MTAKELEVQEKKELATPEEKTEPGTYFLPNTDIHESPDSIIVSMDMPGVARGNVDIELEKNVLTVTGRVAHDRYQGLIPVRTEYNVGNFTRRFNITNEVDRDAISAAIDNGVLNITLPKRKDSATKRIEVV